MNSPCSLTLQVSFLWSFIKVKQTYLTSQKQCIPTKSRPPHYDQTVNKRQSFNICSKVHPKLSHKKKTRIRPTKSWLFNRDPYCGLWKNRQKKRGKISSPTNPLNNLPGARNFFHEAEFGRRDRCRIVLAPTELKERMEWLEAARAKAACSGSTPWGCWVGDVLKMAGHKNPKGIM